MKGPFGMLLVGGGLILLIGLFSGKITFPGAGSNALAGPPVPSAIPGVKSPVSQSQPPGANNNGQQIGNPACPQNWVWDPINKKCFTPGGLLR